MAGPFGWGTTPRTLEEVAEALEKELGSFIAVTAHSPDVFLKAVLDMGADPAYMNCVYTQFKLNAANKIPGTDKTFDNFEAITGRKPTTWKEFAVKVAAESQ